MKLKIDSTDRWTIIGSFLPFVFLMLYLGTSKPPFSEQRWNVVLGFLTGGAAGGAAGASMGFRRGFSTFNPDLHSVASGAIQGAVGKVVQEAVKQPPGRTYQ